MAQSIVCGGCGAAVPYGRLSCPECGEMLASVAGVSRRPSTNGFVEPSPLAGTRTLADLADPPARSASPVLDDSDVEADEAAAGRLTTWPTPVDEIAAGLDFDDDPDLRNDLEAGLPMGGPAPSPSSRPAVVAAAAGTPVAPVAPPPAGMPPPTDLPAEVPVAAFATYGAASAWSAPPGSYVPPVLQPAGPSAPARAWAGYAGGDPGSTGPGGAPTGVAPAVSVTPGAETATSSRFDAGTAAEFVGWLAIAGATLATVGFLLPWSVSVIGASGVGYFDRWGLAGSGHLLLVAGVLGILAAAILRERVPIWLGIGLPGLGVGALLVGLVWPYVVGPLGAQLGALVVGLGALLLVGAGIAALVVDRHERDDRVV
jgi:hypothetical protein